MEKNIFLDTLLEQVKQHLSNIHGKDIDVSFIDITSKKNHCFVNITDYLLETVIILSNLFSQTNITFSCLPIFQDNKIIEIEFHFIM
ncbi:TPA: hypothetical protein U1Z93_001880 [Streptococcus suis]|nr:hypothetical protein [Streptococcus suis]HEM4643378.1 hypothetical protein [Streptococcus suis]